MDVVMSLNARCFVDSDKCTTPGPGSMISGLWGSVIGLGLLRSANLRTPSVLFINAANQRAVKDGARIMNERYLSWCISSNLVIHKALTRFLNTTCISAFRLCAPH